MQDLEATMALETCLDFLTIAQLKEVCQHRGFSPLKKDKASLVACVAPRLADKTGAAEAIASLDRNSLRLLHRIAADPGQPELRSLREAIKNTYRLTTAWDDSDNFSYLVFHLLRRGLLLASDGASPHSRESRYAGLRLCVPQSHRPLLPPYPLASRRVDPRAPANPAAFWLGALALAAAGLAADDRSEAGAGPRYAAGVSFKEGRLLLAGADPTARTTWRESLRDFWLNARDADASLSSKAAGLIQYILQKVPAGHGCRPADLGAELTHHGLRHTAEALRRFFADGLETGQLVVDHGGEYYALAPAERTPGVDDPAACLVHPEGFRVKPGLTDPDKLIRLLRISQVLPHQGELILRPDLSRISRVSDGDEELAAIRDLLTRAPAYGKAFQQVRALQGKTLVHRGLTVLRIEDPAFRIQLAHALGVDCRPLGGPFWAIPQARLGEVEALARKAGLAPRRAS